MKLAYVRVTDDLAGLLRSMADATKRDAEILESIAKAIDETPQPGAVPAGRQDPTLRADLERLAALQCDLSGELKPYSHIDDVAVGAILRKYRQPQAEPAPEARAALPEVLVTHDNEHSESLTRGGVAARKAKEWEL